MNHEAVEHLRAGAVAPRRRPVALAARVGSQLARRLLAVQGRREAIADCALALVASRALVWLAGSGTIAALGFGPARKAFDPPGLTRGFGWLGDVLAGPAARWDSAWYLVIAQHGYRADLGAYTAPRAAFFPLYPLGLRAISWLGSPPVLAGVLISTLALAVALYGIHRLTMLELEGGRTALGRGASPREVARLAVMLTAFAPMAFFLSAVYSESLFLALSVGVFWSARQGRWALASALGALGAATRSAGVVLLVPVLILYLYGPRADCVPDLRSRVVRAALRVRSHGARGRLVAALVPRYRVRRNIVWLAFVPAGLAAYIAYLGFAGGDALAPFHAQGLWGRHFAGPFGGVWTGIKAGFEGARQLLSFQQRHVYFPLAGGSASVAAGHNLLLLAFLAAAVPAAIGVLRTLPLAYGAYVLAALAMPLSYPVPAQPLMSLPRFLLVLFPLNMWLAGRLAAHGRRRGIALGLSAALLALFAAEFATWHWVS
jgi:hypothetical protein